jgi:hypothetical protein
MMTILHIVLIDWKQGIQEAGLNNLRSSARGMSRTIPGIIKIEEGHSVSPEGLEDGFDYALVVTFANAAARDAYLPHPDHQAVAQKIAAHCNRVLVFDLTTDEVEM